MMPMTEFVPFLRLDLSQPGRLSALLALLLLPLLLLLAPAVQAQSQAPIDPEAGTAQVLAGMVSYVRWPQPQPQLQLCIIGVTRYAGALTEERLSTSSQRIRPRNLSDLSAGELAGCQLVYLGRLSEADNRKLLTLLLDRPVLSIAEIGVTCDAACMFCLKQQPGQGQVVFDANLDAIARSGLRVHPSVLQLSRRKPPQP